MYFGALCPRVGRVAAVPDVPSTSTGACRGFLIASGSRGANGARVPRWARRPSVRPCAGTLAIGRRGRSLG